MYTVYILYSDNFKKHYTGFSSDFDSRFKSHNELATKGWAIRYRPWRLIHFEKYENKKEAIVRERWLKTGRGRDFIKKLPH